MTNIKTPVTIRLSPELLAQVRRSAERENRSLTNFIETALRQQVREPGQDGGVALRSVVLRSKEKAQ